MLNAAIILLASTLSLASAVTLPKRQSPPNTAAAAAAAVVANATYDGQCFYPKPTDAFNLTSYLGRWYQVAGTLASFTSGCKCIHADYALNPNGTVNVLNACERQGQASSIEGTATPISPDAGYGGAGVLRVQFPGQPAPRCPGPNYIVQDVGDAARGDSFAIVQTGNFSTLFVLSREQKPRGEVISAWLKKAEGLGSDLSNVAVTDQSDCQVP